ncbi:FAD-binding oxidoreductase [Planotetraspora sp. A-T 1434]|uniref:FAD-binding oxidoreductase n=1 Tax=Planotetraspora sp. A-T 1434 TaxID=2979219 RepID=UPI0021BF16F1|nr:FAD-binding oxidoreductase [Planotetraspora sp. A-T 1434]MCT9932124.1 FAD-binding oxidoreductase [Planotetraspora sp. A-T 1434]
MGQSTKTRPPLAAPGIGVPAAVRRLRQEFDGVVHLPGQGDYDELRQSLNPAIDPRPALVAEAAGPADVRAALVTARDHGLPFAVQATGHGTHVPADGGILLKTTRMSTVLIDPDRSTARVGPGALWSDVIAAATPFGLAPLAGSSPEVGVTGYTLGGGLGWLSRAHGFAADSVLRAEVVTADGHVVTASPDSHPDLWWALRGGGANFGVVTSLEFRLHPVARVYAGAAYFATDPGRAAHTLAAYRDWAATAPMQLSTALLLRQMPATAETPEPVRGRRVLVLKAMHAGDAGQARRLLAPLWRTTGPALWEDFAEMSFGQASMGGTAVRHLDLLETLPDPVIATLAEAGGHADAPAQTIEIRHWGGAMADPGPDAGPVGHRSARFSVIINTDVPGLPDALRPYATGGSFLNFLTDPTRTHTAHTPADHRRLRQIKHAYDPANFFRTNLNIAPEPSADPRTPGAAMA